MITAKEKFRALKLAREYRLRAFEYQTLLENPIKRLDGKDYILTEQDKQDIADKIKAPVVEKVIEKIIQVETPVITEVAVGDIPELLADKINTLEERILIKTIKGLRKELDDIKKEIKRGGGKGKLGGSGGSGGLSVLTATGTINDSNMTFTFTSTPQIVVVSGASYINGQGVTIVGTTATLDNPAGVGGSVYGLG